MDIIPVFETGVSGSSPDQSAKIMKRDCFFKVEVTRDDFDGSYYFPKQTETWWIGGFTWREVLSYIDEWHERGADAVVLEEIGEEEFYQQMPS